LYTSAYVSIRQHTPVHVSIRAWYIRPPGARRLSPGFHTRTVAISGRGPVLRFIAPMLAVIGLQQRIRQHTSEYASIRQYSAPVHRANADSHRTTAAHTPAYVRIRQLTPAYVSTVLRFIAPMLAVIGLQQRIRQHTSEYVSSRQHTSVQCSGSSRQCWQSSDYSFCVSIFTFVLVKQVN
jgi:hypothetical protein